MTNDSDSFIQEVDESLRQDRALALARRWGPWVIGAFVLVLAGVLGWQGWQDYQLKQGRSHAEEYAAAQALAVQGNFEEAKIAFSRLSTEGPRNYRVMAKMEQAAVLEAEGDLDAAVAAFDEAAEMASDPVMRDTARLRAAYIAAETQDLAAMQERLNPIIESDSRFAYLARELLGLEAWEAGNLDLARDTLENLTLAFDAPEQARQRAQVALSVIGPAPTGSADGAQAPAPSEGETK